MRYVDSLIEWLENHAMSGTGARLTPKQCGEIANRLRSEEGPEPISGICGKPGQHAPGCDCAGMMEDFE